MSCKVVMIDDEPLALRRLQIILADFPDIELVGTANGRAEGLERIKTQKPDIVLLDIRMRDGSGFDVIDAMPAELTPAIIFVTAFDDFAIKAFEVNAADYLLKPVSVERLRQALDRARAAVETTTASERIADLRNVVDNLRDRLRETTAPRFEAEFWVRRNATDFVRVGVDSIIWISAEDDYVRLHTADRSYLLRETITGVVARLDPSLFIRVHRAKVVRISSIAQVRRVGIATLELELAGGVRLRAGRIYAKALRQIVARLGAAKLDIAA